MSTSAEPVKVTILDRQYQFACPESEREALVRARDALLERTRELYAEDGLSVLDPLGFNNTYAILVRRQDARTLDLRTIGDLRSVASRWTPGFGYEFIERADGAYIHDSEGNRILDGMAGLWCNSLGHGNE